MKLRRCVLRVQLCCALVSVLLSPATFAVDPGWWTARGVFSGTPNDYVKLNLGQLKNMAAKARDELNASLPNGAGPLINTLVTTTWAATKNDDDDYAECNLGLFKAVAKLYWDRLIATGFATATPWTAATGDDDDHAAANLGQLKTAFTFL